MSIQQETTKTNMKTNLLVAKTKQLLKAISAFGCALVGLVTLIQGDTDTALLWLIPASVNTI